MGPAMNDNSRISMMEIPRYTRLDRERVHPVIAAVTAEERSPEFQRRFAREADELMASAGRPQLDCGFLAGLQTKEGGTITWPMPQTAGQCLLLFTGPVRTGDYIVTQMRSGPAVNVAVYTPDMLLHALTEFREAGVTHIGVDRCPRCGAFTAVSIRGIATHEPLLGMWAAAKAGERLRSELYLRHVVKAARDGDLDAARDTALQAFGHVVPDDPAVHLAIGKVAVALGDNQLLEEAKQFLRYLNRMEQLEMLEQLAAIGHVDFGAEK